MKNVFFILITTLIVSACSRPSKDLATVEIGMTKAEVTGIVGEPKKKNVLNNTETWDYPDSSRIIIFRKDTVYSIMTSPKARIDSLDVLMDSTGSKLKKGINKVGNKLEKAGDKIRNKETKDTTKNW
jgi:outer membrane protein assembly factor BamE (lipoprotein component of BamABCDE complex)